MYETLTNKPCMIELAKQYAPEVNTHYTIDHKLHQKVISQSQMRPILPAYSMQKNRHPKITGQKGLTLLHHLTLQQSHDVLR